MPDSGVNCCPPAKHRQNRHADHAFTAGDADFDIVIVAGADYHRGAAAVQKASVFIARSRSSSRGAAGYVHSSATAPAAGR